MDAIRVEPFGTSAGGVAVERWVLTNAAGARAAVLSFGATLAELWVPDRDGALGDVLLGFDTLAEHEAERRWFGCVVGPVANRIAGARFTLDGREHRLEANDGPNHLHGGRAGLSERVWRAHEATRPEGPAVRLAVRHADGDGGYPGNLDVEVTYVLADEGALRIEYRATSDAPTPVNLTNHAFFDLGAGGRAGAVLGHVLRIDASRTTERDEALIPTGRLLPVDGTPLDFRTAKPVGRDLARVPGGYDHNYVLKDARDGVLAPAAALHDPVSGRVLALETSEPGVQLYTANGLDLRGKRGARYGPHGALCLEAQAFPDAVHHPHFPSIVLRPGETYQQTTVYRFGTDAGFATPSSRRSA